MKKTGLLFIFCLLTFNAFSQVHFNLRVSPALALSRLSDKNTADATSVSGNGPAAAFVGGAALEFEFTDNLALNIGLNYVATSLNAKFSSGGFDYTSKRTVQYVQTPITLKAYTNEIATNMKLYFQIGPTLNIKIAEKLKSSNWPGGDPDKDAHNIVSPIDAGIYLGAGVTYKMGESNDLFAGLYYNRGLTNVYQTNGNIHYYDNARAHMDLLGLEVGIRF
ncbi:MAG TPA: porin family protein [Cytophagaceae bacterium]|jgi:hypothetical protein|nr:porin family protein [Cytophagaceae bacterium]